MLLTLDGYTSGEVSLVDLGTAAMGLISCGVKISNEKTLTDISTIFAQVTMENGGYMEVYEKLRQLIVNFEMNLQKNLQDY